MKRVFVLLLLSSSLFFGCTLSDKHTVAAGNISNHSMKPTAGKMKIKIRSSTFNATLYDNTTAAAFRSLLPMTVTMVELNENEKYVELSRDLPTNESNPGTIHSGELMLYGSSTLVLFYKDFSTSYSYTRLGRIDDVTGLATAVGSGNVTVTYEVE